MKTSKEKLTGEIINPIPGKGIDRELSAYDWDTFNDTNIPDNERPEGFEFPNESNMVDIGFVIRQGEKSLNRFTVTVTATDESQNTTINGTGNVVRIYKNGHGKTVYYYPFHYEIKTPNKHTIKFESDGVTESISFDAS